MAIKQRQVWRDINKRNGSKQEKKKKRKKSRGGSPRETARLVTKIALIRDHP